MDDAGARVIDLMFGRWRSPILYTGVKLGVFDALSSGPKSAVRVASALDVDADLLYRLMRALGSLELLHADTTRTFALTPMGERLCRDHPLTLRGITLLIEGQEQLFQHRYPVGAGSPGTLRLLWHLPALRRGRRPRLYPVQPPGHVSPPAGDSPGVT